MIDLNDLIIFDKVAAFRSFSVAARTMGVPKSRVSRAVGRLEGQLGIRLVQRNTRSVELTAAGEELRARAAGGLAQIGEAVDFAAGLGGTPTGTLRLSCGIGFGINVLGRYLPPFLERFPDVHVALDLTSREADLVADGVDVAIRMGPLPDPGLVVARLGGMTRHLCAAPAYLARRGWPRSPADLAGHELIDMPNRDGRPRTWPFTRGDRTERIEVAPRISVNEALTIVTLVAEGAGVGVVSGYLCAPFLATGALVALCPEWRLPSLDVSLVFPSRREMSPTVRAFVDFMREKSASDPFWMAGPSGAEAS